MSFYKNKHIIYQSYLLILTIILFSCGDDSPSQGDPTLVAFEGFDSLDILAETFFSGIAEFSLVSIPMFIVMGAAIASSPAGKDLYEALDRWLHRVPGGLIISNIGAC